MKIATLKTVGHNIADSLSSGVGLLIGYYQTNVFAEAENEDDGYLTIDFLAGTTTGRSASESFRQAVRLYSGALRELCAKHNVEPANFEKLEVRYGTDRVYGPHFTVTVRSTTGKESMNRYLGMSGRRLQRRR